MLKQVEASIKKLFSWFELEEKDEPGFDLGKGHMKIIRKGSAMRVIFFYPGEEGTYVDNANVILYENGIVHISSNQEETTTHLQNCEILWRFETDADERVNKVRLLKPKTESRASDDRATDHEGDKLGNRPIDKSISQLSSQPGSQPSSQPGSQKDEANGKLDSKSELKLETKSGKGNSSRNPELLE